MTEAVAVSKPKLTTVRIDRPHWGQDTLRKVLNGKKGSALCCLGFCALRAGAKPKDIRGHGRPSDNDKLLPLFAKSFPFLVKYDKGDELYYEQSIMDSLIDKNDDASITWPEREKEIRTLGKDAGIRFVFTGKWAPWQRRRDAELLKDREGR